MTYCTQPRERKIFSYYATTCRSNKRTKKKLFLITAPKTEMELVIYSYPILKAAPNIPERIPWVARSSGKPFVLKKEQFEKFPPQTKFLRRLIAFCEI